MDEELARVVMDDSIDLLNRVNILCNKTLAGLPAQEREWREWQKRFGIAMGGITDLMFAIEKIHPQLAPTKDDFHRVAVERGTTDPLGGAGPKADDE